MSAVTILDANQLSKSYGSIVALEGATVRFEEDKIYGLFGRNGAGKTTLLDILSARIYANKGEVHCFGQDILTKPESISQHCCYMPEKNFFPKRFKVQKLLDHAKASFPHYDETYAARLCQAFSLNANQKYGALSRGYQSIFRIVIGLASNAPITIFDEPVLGLDAVARDRFYGELIAAFADNPRLFIVSTHYIDESVDLFNEAIILKDGRVIRQGAVDEMLANVFYVSGKAAHVDAFVADDTVISQQAIGGLKTAVIDGTPPHQPVPGLSFSSLTMQKLFIHLTNDEDSWEQP
ncbi:MAG: ABC transporter ATP-binding protein [Chloroflexota bacterium]